MDCLMLKSPYIYSAKATLQMCNLLKVWPGFISVCKIGTEGIENSYTVEVVYSFSQFQMNVSTYCTVANWTKRFIVYVMNTVYHLRSLKNPVWPFD